MKKYFIISVCMFGFWFVTYGQNLETDIERCRAIVDSVNAMPLDKYTYGYESDKIDVSIFEQIGGAEVFSIYKDSTGAIRKAMDYVSYPEVLSLTVLYFDTLGDLVLSIMGNYNIDGAACGYRYMFEGKQVFCDVNFYIEHLDSTYNVSYQGAELITTKTWFSQPFDRLLHTDSINGYTRITENQTVEKFVRNISFKPPNANQRSIINTNNAPLKSSTACDSDTLKHLDAGSRITIVEVAAENYKVKYRDIIGYVRKELVEPVEFTEKP